MQVKVYTGSSTTAVLASIKADLGPDAVILDTRETRENGTSQVRITAALDTAPMPSGTRGGRGGISGSGGGNGGGNGGRYGAVTASDAFFGRTASMPGLFAGNLPASQAGAASPPGWTQWHEEWSSIKEHLLALMKPGMQLDRLTPRQKLAVEFLQREGVDDSVALELVRKLLHAPGASILDPLADLVPVRAWGEKTWEHTLHLVCGPYGAGKTTAAVRLALHLRKASPHLRIALCNADCERGGGRLLLRNYAELSDFTYRETRSRLESAAALADLKSQGFDRIIVDMPGLPRGKAMQALLEEAGFETTPAAMHLALTPQLDADAYRSLLGRYTPIPGTGKEMSLLWTKLDEAEKYGCLVNVSAACRLPVSALSFGPGLRDTLVPARDVALWRLLFKREIPNGRNGNAA